MGVIIKVVFFVFYNKNFYDVKNVFFSVFISLLKNIASKNKAKYFKFLIFYNFIY